MRKINGWQKRPDLEVVLRTPLTGKERAGDERELIDAVEGVK